MNVNLNFYMNYELIYKTYHYLITIQLYSLLKLIFELVVYNICYCAIEGTIYTNKIQHCLEPYCFNTTSNFDMVFMSFNDYH